MKVVIAILMSTSFAAAHAQTSYSYTVSAQQVGWASDVMYGHVVCTAQKAYFQPAHVFVRTARLDLLSENHLLTAKCISKALEMVENPKYKKSLVPVYAAQGSQADILLGQPHETGSYGRILCSRWQGSYESVEFALPWVSYKETISLLSAGHFAFCLSNTKPTSTTQQGSVQKI